MSAPYMIQLCGRLFSIDQSSEDAAVLTRVCTNWFYQALDHCSTLLMRKPGCQKLWQRLLKLKRLIFPENETSLLTKRIDISIHPDLLSPSNCQELANQVIRDYINFIPRYLALLNENRCLWLILRGILGVIIIGTCVLVLAKRYSTFQSTIAVDYPKPLSLKERLLDKNIKRVLYETKYLSVVPEVNPDLLQCGCPTLGLKIEARKFFDIHAILVGSSRRENPADADNAPLQAAERLKHFFRHSGNYRLVISLDLDCGDDEGTSKVTPPVKTSGIPIHKPSRRIGIRRRL